MSFLESLSIYVTDHHYHVLMHLRPVEDGWDRQHGDDNEYISTAAHVTGHDQHLGEGRVKGKLHHQASCWCQST